MEIRGVRRKYFMFYLVRGKIGYLYEEVRVRKNGWVVNWKEEC